MKEGHPAKPAAQVRFTVALAGNPNAGKTTIFNQLSGSRQHVGNYPGVTVEKREGRFRHGNADISIVDLPGTYSLTAFSEDELVARDFVVDERPDLVVDILDASNLERNLYLGVQFMELGLPLILVFNMSDVAEAKGCVVDTKILEELLGVTIVRTVANRGEGIEELKQAIVRVAGKQNPPRPATVHYGREIETEIDQLAERLNAESELEALHRDRWLALKLLEGDEEVHQWIRERSRDPATLLRAADEAIRRIEAHFGDRASIVVADQRYGFISGACREAVRTTSELRHSVSDRIDEVVMSRLLGVPIFLAAMYLVFKFTFTLGEPMMGWIEGLFNWLGMAVASAWPPGAAAPLRSLVIDGVINGVGGVLVFLPNILLLFFAIALLEDSGYMARAAFVVDNLMHRIGLHGRSFIPMLIGFGCTVPAILATRSLESRRDRLTTMLVLPLMSCGARLPIYTLFISAFFPEKWRTPILMLMYLIGIVLAAALIKLLRVAVFKGETHPFVMELPPYRAPTLRGALQHTWERGWLFVRKAGTVIVGFSVVLWILTSYPKPPEASTHGMVAEQRRSAELSYSVAGRVGRAMEPVMRHVGFDWKTSTALIGAFAAKEIFVSQLAIVNAVGAEDGRDESLRTVLQREYTRLQAFCIMLFCLISVPCMMTCVTTGRESGSWRWALLQLGGLTGIAYVVTFVVYQGGLFIGALL